VRRKKELCDCGHSKWGHVSGTGCFRFLEPNAKANPLSKAICSCMREYNRSGSS